MTFKQQIPFVMLAIFSIFAIIMVVTSNNLKEMNSKTETTAIVKAYCPCEKCCGCYADGKTATGSDASLPGLAVDPDEIPYGTKVGIGNNIFVADDTGSAVRKPGVYTRMEIRMPTHQMALEWGKQEIPVTIYHKAK